MDELPFKRYVSYNDFTSRRRCCFFINLLKYGELIIIVSSIYQTDRSGFYTYIKDNDDIWCPTNEPCKSKPDKWSSTHGMGYTRFEAEKNGLEITSTYFVGEYENALIWNLKIKIKF